MASFPLPHYFEFEFARTHVHYDSYTIQPSHPLSPTSALALNLSQNQGISKELALRSRWPKYWCFSFSISPSSEYSGLISSSINWFDLLVVQGALKSLLQHHSSKASILQHSALFIVQFLHSCMTTGKVIGLITLTFVGKGMSL